MGNFVNDTLHLLQPETRFAVKRLFPEYFGFGCRVRVCLYSHKLCKDCNLRFNFRK